MKTKRPSLEHLLAKYNGDGPYLKIDGESFIDAASGTFNLPLGYTNKRIADKLKQQIDRCTHLSSSYTGEMSQIILQKLRKHLPKKINRIWLRDVSGSGAVECAIRMAQKYSGKSGVISLYLAHHGQSLATAQISGNAFRLENFSTNIEGSIKVPVPTSMVAGEKQSSRALKNDFVNLEQVIEYGSTGNIACMIIEPILGNGGNVVLPVEFYKMVNSICRKYGIIIIADEVQTGFGRTGSFFASNGYAKELDPDIIVFAKGAGGVGIPTGGVLMKKNLDVLESYEHSSTSGANPLSLVALNEVIDIIEDDGLCENVQKNQKYLENSLLALQKKYNTIENVRGVGYMYGFDTPTPAFAAKAIQIANKHKLIIRGSRYGKGRALKIRPPLICTREHIDEICNKLDSTFRELKTLLGGKNESIKI